MGIALAKLAEEDPTFVVRVNEQTGQTLISGMGELHLEVLVDRLKREFKVDARVGKPRVSYRETITGSGTGRRTFHSPDRRQRPIRSCRDPGRTAAR